MMRMRIILGRAGFISVWLMPRPHEKKTRKDFKYSYLDPALVPLGEKPKV